MLLQEVNNISTDWKEIISNWINTNTENGMTLKIIIINNV